MASTRTKIKTANEAVADAMDVAHAEGYRQGVEAARSSWRLTNVLVSFGLPAQREVMTLTLQRGTTGRVDAVDVVAAILRSDLM